MPHKIGVIFFPGSNCELEALRACQRSHMASELFRWNDDYLKLKKYDAFILPGGFSYEDRGRSGIVASQDPVVQMIKKEHEKGKPILGLCNGAQILVETGMIPGVHDQNLEMALGWNERVQKGKILGVGFYNDWIYMRSDVRSGRSVFNRFGNNVIMRAPVAHGEGRFTTREPNLLKNLIENEQTLFRYCDASGHITPEFPINPNAAMYNLAGVCNLDGTVLALMPHPERSISGQPIFDSLADFLKSGRKTAFFEKKLPSETKQKNTALQKKSVLHAKAEKLSKKPDIVILIRLIITDNEERTIENTLKRIGFPGISLKRQVYLGMTVKNKKDSKKIAEKLLKSGEILNLNKEIPTIFIGEKTYEYTKENGLRETKNSLPKGLHFYITEFDNYTGNSIHENLKQHLQDHVIEKVERGVFWSLQMPQKKIADVLKTNIFSNPHSMKMVEVNL